MTKVYRSSITGTYVSEAYARDNPGITIAEEVPDPTHIVWLRGDWDWQGVYVDGVLYGEGHAFEFDDALEIAAAHQPFTYEVKWIDQDWADESGLSSLPELLDEVRIQS